MKVSKKLVENRPRSLIACGADEGARFVLVALFRTTAAAAGRLRSGRDEEALHDFRTSLRRTRSVLKAYGGLLGRRARRFEKEVRKIADSTSAARDAEVQLAWLLDTGARTFSGGAGETVKALVERLERDRRAGYEHARQQSVPAFRALEKEARRWLGRERSAPESFGRFTASVLREISTEIAALLKEIASPKDEAAIHTARIRGKRLRYVLEPLQDEHPIAAEALLRLKTLQDVLGEIHDRLVLLRLFEDASSARAKRGRTAQPMKPLRTAAEAELRRYFADLRRDWLRGGASDLFARTELLASELEGSIAPRSPENTEIERKFLLRRLPRRARSAPAKEIWQGWIPGARLQERLRRVKQNGREEFFRTVKIGRGIERTEIEEQTPPSLFEQMWPLTEGRRVLKRRYVVKDGQRTWELDEFLDRGLYLAEVELPSADTEVTVPEWLQKEVEREVTGEDAYVNVNLAR